MAIYQLAIIHYCKMDLLNFFRRTPSVTSEIDVIKKQLNDIQTILTIIQESIDQSVEERSRVECMLLDVLDIINKPNDKSKTVIQKQNEIL